MAISITSTEPLALHTFPTEIFDLVIEHLVVTIGIRKAALLRTVNRAFNTSILDAICLSQVIDIHHPGTPRIASWMPPTLRGKIIAAKSRSTEAGGPKYLSVVKAVQQTLEKVAVSLDQQLDESWLVLISGEINIRSKGAIDAGVQAQNLLSAAAIIGHLAFTKLLLDGALGLPVLPKVDGHTPYFENALCLAAAYGHLAVVQYLLHTGARPIVPSYYENEESLLDTQARWITEDPNTQLFSLRYEEHHSPLRAAVQSGHADIVHLLLRPEHRPHLSSVEYLRAVLAGARFGRIDLIRTLLHTIGKELSDFPGLGEEMLRTAAHHDQRAVVRILAHQGIDVNCIPFPEGRTNQYGALWIASAMGHVDMVHLLLEAGANVHLITMDYGSAIKGAACRGQQEVVDILIEHGADPATAFLSAAQSCQPLLIRHLLDRFPALAEGECGQVALSDSIVGCNLTAISILVESGVSLNLHSSAGYGLYGPRWVTDHLYTLGARTIDSAEWTRNDYHLEIRDVRLSKHTWEWVSKH
ncbi:F-box domain and ankyrin repeat [Lecanosticta acicola]|uniref:F-box domain and ankyrin repeat n=1 Tax=Lecanosticta acicola TaxID=111012 RepID=A0AAI8YVG1_9PEZI|nr:F-box domain and ankyrin repeat [Lecanosticta acicola]